MMRRIIRTESALSTGATSKRRIGPLRSQGQLRIQKAAYFGDHFVQGIQHEEVPAAGHDEQAIVGYQQRDDSRVHGWHQRITC